MYIESMSKMSTSTFKLYVYLMEMSSDPNFKLSRDHALRHTGLAKSTYYNSLEELCSIGIIKRNGCHYTLGGNNYD